MILAAGLHVRLELPFSDTARPDSEIFFTITMMICETLQRDILFKVAHKYTQQSGNSATM